jgi:hypothetical protein
MHRSKLAASTFVLATLTTAAAFTLPTHPAHGLLPRCNPECPDPRDPPDPSPEPTTPPAQARPPAPNYGAPSRYDYSTFAVHTDAAIKARLMAPGAATDAWPLPTFPYTPEIANTPVSVRKVEDNLWAFTSFDSGGRAADCLGQCSDVPAFPFNPNYGLYQATLKLHPRLDIELWQVLANGNIPGPPFVPSRVAEVTATLDVRAFAECNHWETGNANLNARAGIDNVTMHRDTSIDEDLLNFVVPSYTTQQNIKIRNGIKAAIGVGQFSAIAFVNGTRCYTLGATGNAVDGAIAWNQEPCQPFACNDYHWN